MSKFKAAAVAAVGASLLTILLGATAALVWWKFGAPRVGPAIARTLRADSWDDRGTLAVRFRHRAPKLQRIAPRARAGLRGYTVGVNHEAVWIPAGAEVHLIMGAGLRARKRVCMVDYRVSGKSHARGIWFGAPPARRRAEVSAEPAAPAHGTAPTLAMARAGGLRIFASGAGAVGPWRSRVIVVARGATHIHISCSQKYDREAGATLAIILRGVYVTLRIGGVWRKHGCTFASSLRGWVKSAERNMPMPAAAMAETGMVRAGYWPWAARKKIMAVGMALSRESRYQLLMADLHASVDGLAAAKNASQAIRTAWLLGAEYDSWTRAYRVQLPGGAVVLGTKRKPPEGEGGAFVTLDAFTPGKRFIAEGGASFRTWDYPHPGVAGEVAVAARMIASIRNVGGVRHAAPAAKAKAPPLPAGVKTGTGTALRAAQRALAGRPVQVLDYSKSLPGARGTDVTGLSGPHHLVGYSVYDPNLNLFRIQGFTYDTGHHRFTSVVVYPASKVHTFQTMPACIWRDTVGGCYFDANDDMNPRGFLHDLKTRIYKTINDPLAVVNKKPVGGTVVLGVSRDFVVGRYFGKEQVGSHGLGLHAFIYNRQKKDFTTLRLPVHGARSVVAQGVYRSILVGYYKTSRRRLGFWYNIATRGFGRVSPPGAADDCWPREIYKGQIIGRCWGKRHHLHQFVFNMATHKYTMLRPYLAKGLHYIVDGLSKGLCAGQIYVRGNTFGFITSLKYLERSGMRRPAPGARPGSRH